MDEPTKTDWVDLANAKRQLAACNTGPEILVEHLRAGLISARCKRRIEEVTDRDGSRLKPIVVDDETVPAWVWDSIGRPFLLHRWDWNASYFQGKASAPHGLCLVKLFGIEVQRTGVDELAPPCASGAAVEPLAEGGSEEAGSLPAPQAPKRKQSRPSFKRQILEAFIARLRAGNIQQTNADEARQMLKQWKGNKPGHETVSKHIAQFFNSIEWDGRRVSNVPKIIADIEQNLNEIG